MPKIDSLEKLFIDELHDMYDAEKQILKALPKMVKEASSDELREAFERHREVTEQQVERLGRVFEILGVKAKGKTCAGMKGIIDEGEEYLKAKMDDFVKDAALLASAQKVEHYEISAYGTLAAHAKTLGHDDAMKILHEIMEEERRTDEELTRLAESGINFEALDDEESHGLMDQDEESDARHEAGSPERREGFGAGEGQRPS